MSLGQSWLCYYNGEASLDTLVHAEDAREAVRGFVTNTPRTVEIDWEPVYVWVRAAGTERRTGRLFVAERPRDGGRRLVYEESL